MVIKQKHLIAFQIYYMLIVEMLIDILHFPSIIRYVLDVNAILIALLALNKLKIIISDKVFKRLNIYIMLYMLGAVFVSILFATPLGRILWAFRNNYLYLIFFLCCAYTLSLKDFDSIMKNCIRFSFFNAICVFYEYVVLHLYGDNVGGMFGSSFGCNGLLNVYLFVITAYSIVMFAKKKASIFQLLWIVISSLIIASVSELKFFYIEFALIIIFYLVLSKASLNNTFLLLGIIVAFYVAIQIIGAIQPDIVEFFSDIDKITSYSYSTYNNTIINRGTVFSQIHNLFFGNDVRLNIFGYGLGYCEESKTFAWAQSPFATKYASMGYRNLSASMIILETGYLGLVAFIAIFIFIFIIAQKQKSENENKNQYFIVSQIVSLLLIINIWYNSAIRREIAYLSFLYLASIIIVLRDKRKEELKEQQLNQPKKKSYFK